MRPFKFILSLLFLFAMVGFEVSRDMTILWKTETVDTSILSNINEEDHSKEEKTADESKFEMDVNIHDLRVSSMIREMIKIDIIKAHHVNYEFLEQKVLLPPPEHS